MGSTGRALIVTIVAMVTANVSAHLLFPGHGLIVAACLFAVLIGIALWAGLSMGELGLGRATWARGMRWALWILIGALAVFVVALLLPWTRNLASGPVPGDPWVRVLLTIPLGTVLVEEFAFRGVLWALLRRRYTPRAATLGSAVLFGLWHVLSALGGGSANAAVDTVSGGGLVGSVIRIAGTVLFTGAAGVLFAELRYRSGSLIPSMALHWAVNGLGVAFVVIVLG
ncbi:CAAX prenyl protease-like protein [Antricoccus suffuscus]|uniref:CAAX prenyl protease-like protein n=1 Tax=Antricoccus suffuscus TaxID=1629062 RepID=A0A2T1A127_9ACTN|nr:CPBP family intramembrane glutamic endopeptidase [Antricoccus suffuscus]PRZ42309.1 CAAX prenyl protease-like protein [Antricoccus suffuscus]